MSDDDAYSVSHPVLSPPGPETLDLLLAEARVTFELLYEEAPDEQYVEVAYVPPGGGYGYGDWD